MRLEYYSTQNLKDKILDIMKRNIDLNNHQVFFFGSRVKGNNFKRADIDLGIQGPEKIPAKVKFKIQDELDQLPILYKIDLVDFSSVSQKFKEQALKHIEYVK